MTACNKNNIHKPKLSLDFDFKDPIPKALMAIITDIV
jgi:hypothetical protein